MVHQTVILSCCQTSTRSRWHSGKPLCAWEGGKGEKDTFLAQQEMLTSEGLKGNEQSRLPAITQLEKIKTGQNKNKTKTQPFMIAINI